MNLLVLLILFGLLYAPGRAVKAPFTADSPGVEKVPQKQIITRGLREVTELPDSTVLRKLQVGFDEEIPEDGATIWGELTYSVFPQDRRSRNRLKGRCFEGMGLSSCRAMNLNTDKKKDRALPYYNHMSERINQKYCLQCCGENHEDRDGNDMTEMRPGTSQNDVDVWDMDCEVALDQLQMFNLPGQAYGREYRLATQKEGPGYEAEDDFIVCPIVRSICDYERIGPRDFDGDPSCPEKDSIASGDETFLAGYEMRIDVVERYGFFSEWMEIEGCEVTQVFEVSDMITATEDTSFMFREKLIIFHKPSFEWANVIILAIIFVLLLPVVYVLLYNFRKRKCEVCDKQLVWSSKKCMVCKFFHADAPDPIVRHAIESKALHLNDVEPPKFPLIHAVKDPGERMDALASAEQLHFRAVKDSIRQELKDQAAAEKKAGAHKPTMVLPKDTTGDKVNGEGDSREAYKGERLHHLTPVDAEEVRLLVEEIARRRWKELAIDERLVYEDMEAENAHKAHRLHQFGPPSPTKEEHKVDPTAIVMKPKKAKLYFNKDGTYRPPPKWYQPGMHWFEGWFAKKEERVNPNMLQVHPSVVFEAVSHPYPPPRPGGMIPRYEDDTYGKPVPIVYKNKGKLIEKSKKKRNVVHKQMSHEEWVKAGKPEWDEEKAQKEAEEEEINAERAKKGLPPIGKGKGSGEKKKGMFGFGF